MIQLSLVDANSTIKVYAYAVPNIIFDFLIWLRPIPRIWQLHLGLQQRLSLTLIFAFGLA